MGGVRGIALDGSLATSRAHVAADVAGGQAVGAQAGNGGVGEVLANALAMAEDLRYRGAHAGDAFTVLDGVEYALAQPPADVQHGTARSEQVAAKVQGAVERYPGRGIAELGGFPTRPVDGRLQALRGVLPTRAGLQIDAVCGHELDLRFRFDVERSVLFKDQQCGELVAKRIQARGQFLGLRRNLDVRR